MPKAKGFRASDFKGGELPAEATPNPLKERDELIQQRRAAYEIYAEQTQLRQRAERARGGVATKLREAEGALQRGTGTEKAVDDALDAVEKADALVDKALGKANRALDVTLDQTFMALREVDILAISVEFVPAPLPVAEVPFWRRWASARTCRPSKAASRPKQIATVGILLILVGGEQLATSATTTGRVLCVVGAVAVLLVLGFVGGRSSRASGAQDSEAPK